MELTVSKADLQKELQLCQGVVEKRSTIPILSNVLLKAAGSRLQIAATDLDVTILSSCAASVWVTLRSRAKRLKCAASRGRCSQMPNPATLVWTPSQPAYQPFKARPVIMAGAVSLFGIRKVRTSCSTQAATKSNVVVKTAVSRRTILKSVGSSAT